MSQKSQSLLDWLTLHLIPGLGAGTFIRLLEHFAGPREILQADGSELERVSGLRRDIISELTGTRKIQLRGKAANELEDARKKGVRIIPYISDEYPSLLRTIHSPPMVLYVKGCIESLNTPGIGIVGSRAATSYGRETASRIGFSLAEQGLTVVSGLALGIDSEAHRGALRAGGKTIAVLGCGVDVMYPLENSGLFRKISESGALVSEYPLGTRPDGFRFPARNRIISGLSLGVVVVEASTRSGSLITATHALEQGREVFAIPGRVDSIKSAGTHSLLQQGAKLVHTVADIIDELSWAPATGGNYPPGSMAPNKATEPQAPLTTEEEQVFTFLEVYPKTIDEIVRNTSLSPQKVNEVLLMLELKGLVSVLPGNCYQKTSELN